MRGALTQMMVNNCQGLPTPENTGSALPDAPTTAQNSEPAPPLPYMGSHWHT